MGIENINIVMKFNIQIIFVFLFIASGSYLQAQEPERSSIIETINGKEYYIHLIQPGETFENLEKLYNVSKEKIIESTPSFEEEENLRPNQILRIPFSDAGKEYAEDTALSEKADKQKRKFLEIKEQVDKNRKKEEQSAEKKIISHKVSEGETLFSISRKYNLAVEQIKRVNPDLKQDNLSLGQTISIPVHLAKSDTVKRIRDSGVFDGKKFNAYTVRKGETVYRIAKNFGISQKQLLSMNPQIEVNDLMVGTRIRIPIESKQSDPQPVAAENFTQTKQKTQSEKQEIQDTIRTYRHYKVKFLERVPGISKRQNIDIDTIYKLNPTVKEEGVNWGDVIKLPRKAEVKSEVYKQDTPEDIPADTTINYIIHEVMKKENLYRISKLYDVSLQKIIELNPGAEKQIQKGQKLKIPVIREEKEEKIVKEEKEEEKDLFRQECLKQSGMDKHFEVALMVPLYLDEYKKIDTSEYQYNRPDDLKSMNFIQFYEGALLALDTLEKQGMKVDVYVYDIGKSREEAIKSIDEKLKTVDLIIGPIYNEPFKVMSRFANQHDIRIINPLSGRETIIEGSSDVYKVQTPEKVEIKAMSEYINKHYPDTTDIYVIRDSEYQQQENLQILREELKVDSSYLFEPIRRIVDVRYSVDSLNPLLQEVDSVNKERKVVVTLTHNRIFTIELLRHLNEAHDSIGGLTVFGKSSWRDYKLDSDYLMNLDVHLFDDEYINYESSTTQWFLKNFRQKYHTEPLPEKYAFVGFDVMYYFGSALIRFGHNFEQCLKYHEPDTIQTKMLFRKNKYGSFENSSAIPLRYYNYKLIKMD